ncbi:MAG TPA: ABC transporter ATP-binding protein/permease [Xanthobacteraceae bacterium]|nr:ABC transporter ATP-binding protein/permease [Xanthobacteraceae bacterium]
MNSTTRAGDSQRDDVQEEVEEALADLDQHDKDDEDSKRLRRRLLLRFFWRSARGFWGRGGDRLAWLLTGSLLLTILMYLAAAYGMNVWNRYVFDALERRDAVTVLYLALIYGPLLAASVAVMVFQVYVRMTTQRRWRAWLNHHLLDRWLTNGRYYQLNLVGGDHKNPEYRIADDVRVAVDAPVEFATGLTTAILSAATFIAVLWTIGGSLSFTLGGVAITIPGFLVVAAVIYAVLASGSMVFIGRRFVTVSESKNQAEAEYRYVLTRLAENGESIAVLGGEEEERNTVDQSLRAVLRRWRDICFQTMRTTIVSQTSGYVAPVLPILLCAPKFLEGSMTLGEVMQAASAFTIVQAAFNWLVDNYPRLADWTASARRVASLMVSLYALERAEEGEGVERIERSEGSGAALRLSNLSVTLDNGAAVVKDAEVEIAPGERVLVAGESGTGKSTLVRAIAGLWPWGEGGVEVAAGAKMFLMPQRAYIPVGTLRRAASYPEPVESYDVDDVAKALKRVGLGHLVKRLEEEAPWDQTLSGGEKQRLAFARILLHRPDIIVLDEATSALDPASQDKLMELLTTELDATTIVSVGHRPELEAFHSRKIVLERRRGGARFVTDINLIPRPGRKRLLKQWMRLRRGAPSPVQGEYPARAP